MTVDTQYAFSVSVVRAIEKRLLGREKYDRMIDARTPEEALKFMVEAGYGDIEREGLPAYEYEKILLNEHRKLYELLREIAPEPEFFNLFLLKNDYHNIKVIIKSEILKTEPAGMLSHTGSVDADALRDAIRSKNLDALPPKMAEAAGDAFDWYYRTRDPQVIDIRLDRACFMHMKELADTARNDFVTGLIELLIDLSNLKTFFRVRKMGKTRSFLESVLIPGGKLDTRLFTEAFEATDEEFAGSLRFSSYRAVVEQALELLHRSGKFTDFEKYLDNYLMAYIKKAKYKTLGIEPLIAYLWAKETEIMNLRIIMVGKLNGMPAEMIRERLRDAYV